MNKQQFANWIDQEFCYEKLDEIVFDVITSDVVGYGYWIVKLIGGDIRIVGALEHDNDLIEIYLRPFIEENDEKYLEVKTDDAYDLLGIVDYTFEEIKDYFK